MCGQLGKYGVLLVFVLGAAVVCAQTTPDGLTCQTAIPVDTAYRGSVPQAGTYYYSAWTYDLPMTCYFYPSDPNAAAPNLEVDFTCTPGQYDDAKLAEVVKTAQESGVAIPFQFYFNREPATGTTPLCYTLTIPESNREILAALGVSYNVQAFVKVQAPCAGNVRMAPDTSFQTCVDNSHWLSLPDALQAGAAHTGDSYVLPFSDWQNDSIRFRWTGTASSVRIWIGEICDFAFQTTGDKHALDYFDLSPDAGNNEHIFNYSKQDIADFIKNWGHGGVYYLRIVSAEDAQLIVEQKPMSEAMAKAIPLVFDNPVHLAAHDTAQVYYFPAKWCVSDVLFSAAPSTTVTGYFASVPAFAADADDAHIINVYPFARNTTMAVLGLSLVQMQSIGRKVGDYVFVKFDAAATTSITPSLWSVGECVQKASELQPNDSIRIAKRSSVPWRIRPEEWAKQDVHITWQNSSSSIKLFLGDTCTGYNLNASTSNPHLLSHWEITRRKDGTMDTVMITKEQMSSFIPDADGFLYFRFSNTARGDLLVSQAEPNMPPIPATPAATIALECLPTGNIRITVSQEQDLTLSSGNSLLKHWHQQAGQDNAYTFTPAQGATYTLQGAQETIVIQ